MDETCYIVSHLAQTKDKTELDKEAGKSTWAKETGKLQGLHIREAAFVWKSKHTVESGKFAFLTNTPLRLLKILFLVKIALLHLFLCLCLCLSVSLCCSPFSLSVGQRLEDNLQSLELFLYYMGPGSWSTRWSGLVANTLPTEPHHQPFFLREGFSVSFRLAWTLPQLPQVCTATPDFIEAFLRRIRKGLEIDPVVIWWRERPAAYEGSRSSVNNWDTG